MFNTIIILPLVYVNSDLDIYASLAKLTSESYCNKFSCLLFRSVL